MKRLLTTSCTNTSFNIAALIMRLTFGSMIFLTHGLSKLKNFGKLSETFPDPFNLGHQPSLMLVLFAEVFCSFFVVIGLFTRLAVIPMLITMLVAVFVVSKGQSLVSMEKAVLYMGAFTCILFVGSGKYSLDGVLGK